MVPITSLIFPAAFLVALLLPECELWFFDGYWRYPPREALVDFVTCKGRDTTADACVCPQASAAASDENE